MNDPVKFIIMFFAGAIVATGIAALAFLTAMSPESRTDGIAARSRAGSVVPNPTPTDPQGGQVQGKSPAGQADESKPAPEPGRIEKLESRLEALNRENQELRKQLDEIKTSSADQPAQPRQKTAFRFGVIEKAPVFDAADWPALSGHVAEMNKFMPELMAEILQDRMPSGELLKKLQEHNMPLAMFAIGASKEIEGTGPNGSFTHPAVIANLARSSLEALGMPLSESQEMSIKAIGEVWVGEEERRKASVNPNTIAMAKTVAEVDAKLRFLQAFKTVLTPAQKSALFNPETEGRLQMDLLSPALVYTMIRPVVSTSASELESMVIAELFRNAGIKGLETAQYAWIAKQWLVEAQGATTPMPATSKEVRFPHVNLLQERARAQVAATERLIATNSLTPEQVKSLRDAGMLVGIQVISIASQQGDDNTENK